MIRNHLFFLILSLVITIGCANQGNDKELIVENFEKEKRAIMESLRNETKAACQRDYEAWKSFWVQHPKISKTYMNFDENTFSEMNGWKEVDDFVRTYIEEHPEPVTPPAQPEELDLRLYGTGAWVSFDILDEGQGLKRETRLMEKEGGIWKIAGMHTSIYGLQREQ